MLSLPLSVLFRNAWISLVTDHVPDAKAHSVVLEAFSKILVDAQGWEASEASNITLDGASSSNKPSFQLRPDDTFQIKNTRFCIRGDEIVLPNSIEEVQVKSSNHIMATGDADIEEDEEKRGAVEMDSMLDGASSTPIVPPDLPSTVMETPAASRYQDPISNSSHALESITGNATQRSDSSQCDGEGLLTSQAPSKAGSTQLEAKLLLVSPEEQLKEEANRLIESPSPDIGINIPQFTTDPEESLVLQRDKDGVVQNNSQEHGDHIHLATLAHQEVCSVIAPSGQDIELTNHYETAPETSIRSPAQDSSNLTRTRDELEVTAYKDRKRKRVDDADQDSPKSKIHVVIPVKKSVLRNKLSYAGTPKAQTTPIAVTKKTPTRKDAANSTQMLDERSYSSRKTPLAKAKQTLLSSSSNPELRVFFANSTTIDNAARCMSFLAKQNVAKASSVKECDLLCIGAGDLKRTSNLVLAVLYGKQIVTDDWVKDSAVKGELLDFNNHLARDDAKEAEWGISLSDAIDRGKDGNKPLRDWTLHFTSAAKRELGKGFTDLSDLAMIAGAKSVQASLPRKASEDVPEMVIIIATAHNDSDVSALTHGGWRCFSKDIVTLSILRGQLDRQSDEFLITAPDGERNGQEKKRRRGRE